MNRRMLRGLLLRLNGMFDVQRHHVVRIMCNRFSALYWTFQLHSRFGIGRSGWLPHHVILTALMFKRWLLRCRVKSGWLGGCWLKVVDVVVEVKFNHNSDYRVWRGAFSVLWRTDIPSIYMKKIRECMVNACGWERSESSEAFIGQMGSII